MNDDPISTTPVTPGNKLLQVKFAESLAGQSKLMDKLARQLITLELAIPGIYAAVLKLVQGEDAPLPVNNWLIFTFACWFMATLLTLISLIPRDWKVDPTMLKSDPAGRSKALSLEEFFHDSAQYKRRLLIPACILFWLGIMGAALVIF